MKISTHFTKTGRKPDNTSGLPPIISNRKLLLEPEAALYLTVSRSFLAKRRCSGGGPRFVKIGRRVAYDIHDLDAFAEQCKRRSTSESTVA